MSDIGLIRAEAERNIDRGWQPKTAWLIIALCDEIDRLRAALQHREKWSGSACMCDEEVCPVEEADMPRFTTRPTGRGAGATECG